MRLVCAYCRKVIRHDRGSRILDVSHGMCPACAEHFGKLWNGMSLSEYLDTIPHPVLVLDGDRRILAANRRLASLVGRGRKELRGLRTGDAFACAQSRMPEGCGKNVHCRECTIRRAVTTVQQSGKPLRHVPAWLATEDGRVELKMSVSAERGVVKVVVEKMERRC